MSGLGKGFGSLIRGAESSRVLSRHEADEGDVLAVNEVAVNSIDPNPRQPRDTFPHGGMEELISSVKHYGVIVPLLVTQKQSGRFELIAGERRLRAAKMAGLTHVPVVVRHAEDMEKLELAIIENIQREDLNPIEEAQGFRGLIDEFNLTQEEVAKRMGRSREAVANSLRLLSLPGDLQKAIASRVITPGHGRVLLSIVDPAEQKKLFEQMTRDHLTVREAEAARGSFKNSVSSLRDPMLLSRERAMEEALGTKVLISRRGQKGSIRIDFYGEEELVDIVARITALER